MNTPSRRYLSVWLRRLATDRLARLSSAPADQAFATVAPIKSALRLTSVNDAAAKLGLTFRQFRHRLKKLSGEGNGGNEPEAEDAEGAT
jgi:hypothetical protein